MIPGVSGAYAFLQLPIASLIRSWSQGLIGSARAAGVSRQVTRRGRLTTGSSNMGRTPRMAVAGQHRWVCRTLPSSTHWFIQTEKSLWASRSLILSRARTRLRRKPAGRC